MDALMNAMTTLTTEVKKEFEVRDKSHKALEKQVGQLAEEMAQMRGSTGKLPSDTAVNPKHQGSQVEVERSIDEEVKSLEVLAVREGKPTWTHQVESLPESIDTKLKPSLVEPPEVELKALPKHLKKFANMPPRVRGRGKGPMRGGTLSAGPSHRRTPSASFSSSDSHDMWGQPFEPARHSVSLSSSPSFHPSFGPLVPDEPQLSHHSQQSHHSHESYPSHNSLHSHSFHHSDSPYSRGQFNPADYVNDFLGYNPLGPEDHFSQEMEMDDDPDPEMQIGTPGHPISISSGSPFQGSPYRGPDSFQEKMDTYDWFFTPSYHSSPAQPPLEEPQLQAVSPPPLLVEEPPQQPPQPPPEPPRRRRNARMSVRGGPRFSSPHGWSSYPPIPEDP
ncbi:bromodomain-containing protein 4B-like [Helianthus annuus]|uniref:bromodomain-containing protein 4B-like n=1 Tax=Helianthus annuus TaxID=4232 RepID=UPI000B8FE69B|nr:bromodomain-containing protein 4B-like [Helianthus annuus]